MKRKIGKTPLILAAGVGLLAGLGGVLAQGDDAPAPAAIPSPSVSAPVVLDATPSPSPSPSLACEPVPAAVVEAIQAGDNDGAALVIQSAAAYRLPDRPNAWMVAARFTDTTPDALTGTWATTALDGTGAVVSVDAFAEMFTDYPVPDGMNITTPGVAEARACLDGTK